MNRTDAVPVPPPGSSLAAALRRWLADASLRLKLYIGLGVPILGLLIIASVTSYTSVVNQQMMNQALTRQRHLAALTYEIGDLLLGIQNQALEFYNLWASTGFEGSDQDGFEGARRVYVDPIRNK